MINSPYQKDLSFAYLKNYTFAMPYDVQGTYNLFAHSGTCPEHNVLLCRIF